MVAKRTLSRLKPRLAAAPSRIRPPAKVVDPFYDSPEWRTLVARIISSRGRRCEQCGRTHDEAGQPIRVYADHIVEIKDGGPLLDPTNVQLKCGPCHGAKTQAERTKRLTTRYTRPGK
jgi:5-methylcytosine-specific restriction enzyme A